MRLLLPFRLTRWTATEVPVRPLGCHPEASSAPNRTFPVAAAALETGPSGGARFVPNAIIRKPSGLLRSGHFGRRDELPKANLGGGAGSSPLPTFGGRPGRSEPDIPCRCGGSRNRTFAPGGASPFGRHSTTRWAAPTSTKTKDRRVRADLLLTAKHPTQIISRCLT